MERIAPKFNGPEAGPDFAGTVKCESCPFDGNLFGKCDEMPEGCPTRETYADACKAAEQ